MTRPTAVSDKAAAILDALSTAPATGMQLAEALQRARIVRFKSQTWGALDALAGRQMVVRLEDPKTGDIVYHAAGAGLELLRALKGESAGVVPLHGVRRQQQGAPSASRRISGGRSRRRGPPDSARPSSQGTAPSDETEHQSRDETP